MEPVPDDIRTEVAESEAVTGGGRSARRVLAAATAVAAVLLVYSLSGGPWARATVSDGTSRQAVAELRLSGKVDADPSGGALGPLVDRSTPEHVLVRESVGSATRDLVRVLAVLVIVVAAVGLVFDLPTVLWGLTAATSLVCLLAATVLRDGAVRGLATGLATLNTGAFHSGAFHTSATGWAGLAIGAAAAAALASFLGAAAQRPGPFVVMTPIPRRPVHPPPSGRRRNRPLNWLPSRRDTGAG
jgi:hypothetical protein